VNQAINYAYGMLYGEVWRAIAKVGLDPYFGVLHGSERDQGSLVFDLIEEFRAPFADRLVVAMIGRGLKLEIGAKGFLRTRVRRRLAKAFSHAWCRTKARNGRQGRPSQLLEQQASSLVRLFMGQGDYRPFRMRW
jgi:CRISPR-associated protein Cas1